ncbi:MAG: ATP-binding cassette domain-containing protein [Anaerolineaceae bacterium]|jgi:sodium transport system ATP-binding protein
MIEVNGLKKCFGTVQALKNVTFQAHDNKITGILGPNGAGKTTTLRIIYGIIDPNQGSARVDGIDVRHKRIDAQKRLGVLPESHGLYPRLTARENIRYYGLLQRVGRAVLDRKIDALVSMLEMEDIIDRPSEGFSNGERSKVAIARALIHDPKNILLDEPTSGLDVMSTRAMRSFIRRLRDEGKCVLLSSHIMQEVSLLCDEIVVIAKGEVVAAGSPDSLRATTGRDNLEDAFVAAIGTEEGLER